MSCYATAQELACLFPFLDRTSEFLYARGITLEAALGSQEILKTALEIVEGALRGRRRLSPCVKDLEREAAAARLALYVVASSGSQYALRRFADRESKSFTERLRKTPGIQSPECKASIAADLGVSVALTRDVVKGSLLAVTHPMAVRWTHYLKYAPQDPDWAMINRPVVKGWVLLSVEDFERLLEEAYEARILELAARADIGYISGLLAKIPEIADLMGKLKAYKPTTVKATGEIPPCMQAIMDAIKRGENTPHTARFAVTTYLLKRGWDVEQIVDLFRSSPDFNEKITRYQVSHIAGRAGGRKEYSVPSCETMNSWGLCPTNLGCGVRNPIAYGRRNSAVVRENRA
ncbi:MAG: DNA primase large subunit PriL [Thermoproteus sp.]|nr:DNA primase large subunit PriL [Thermoproteus sp.]